MRLANEMVTDVRQRMVRQEYGRRGRKTDPAWRGRRKLLTGYEQFTREAFMRMGNQLADTGDPGIQILAAWTVKEELRTLLALAGTDPERHVLWTALDAFYTQAAGCSAPEAHRLTATIEAWWPAIEAGISPATPTPEARATTAWSNTRDATPSASETRSTNDAG